jgi:hypothetical protein
VGVRRARDQSAGEPVVTAPQTRACFVFLPYTVADKGGRLNILGWGIALLPHPVCFVRSTKKDPKSDWRSPTEKLHCTVVNMYKKFDP